jgi:hypothetical protein
MSDDAGTFLVLMNMHYNLDDPLRIVLTVNGKEIKTPCCCYYLTSPFVKIRHRDRAITVTLDGYRIIEPDKLPPSVDSLFDMYVFPERLASLDYLVSESSGIHFYLSDKRPDPVGCGE